MKLYLLRHGETVYNVQQRYQGSRDIPLSEKGREELQPADITPAVVYVSPLTRARETASLLFPQARQVVIPDLREMDFGIFEGRSAKEMEQDEIYRAWVEGNCMGQIPEGENMDGFSRRTCDALTKLLNQALAAGEDTLVVVAHGGTQMAAMAEFVLPKKPYFQWLAPNGGGYLLDTAPWKETGKLTLVSKLAYAKGGKR